MYQYAKDKKDEVLSIDLAKITDQFINIIANFVQG